VANKILLKKYFFIVVSIFSSVYVFAQTAVDTTYKTTYYEQKVTLFRLLPNTKGEIVFLGNSITDIGEWAEIWQNNKVRNRGISGDNTFGVLARLDEITSAKPAKVFIMIGINDIAKETPDSIIIANYKKIISRIQSESPKTKIIVQSILPTNNDFTEFKRHQNKTAHVIFINAALENYCKEFGLVYVDLYTVFLDDNKKLDKKYTNDGLHINGYGYMKWKEVLVEMGLMR
jgi:lysophospholipase L1-like esterase